jgi:hypothetical protein
MKYLILIIVCFLSVVSIAQIRYSDVAVSFEYPKDGDTVYALTDLNYSFWLINHGEDSLFASDSLNYEVTTSFPNDDDERFKILGSDIAPGDSLLLYDKLWLHKDVNQKSVSLFFNQRASVFTDFDSDRLLVQEVYPGLENNVDQVDVVYRKSTASIQELDISAYTIFPNPISAGSNLTIKTIKGDDQISINLIDFLGRVVVLDGFVERLDGQISIGIPPQLNGLYHLMILNGAYTNSFKLLVE